MVSRRTFTTAAVLLPLTMAACAKQKKYLDISGYTDKKSYRPGENQILFLTANKPGKKKKFPLFSADGRIVLTIPVEVEKQKISTQNPSSDGFGFKPTVNFKLPDLPSGLYYWGNKIPFVVRPPSTPKRITVVVDTNTAEAYNSAGGKSLYYGEDDKSASRTRTVSFHRPVSRSLMKFSAGAMSWFARQGFDFGYLCDADLDDYSLIAESDLLIIVGHSEYWTRKARENYDRFIAQGKNVLIMSGNTMWWQVRYSDDKSKMICYKNFQEDPETNNLLKTINWPETTLDYPVLPSIGADFINGGINQNTGEEISLGGFMVTNADHPIFQGTGLRNGEIIHSRSQEIDGQPEGFGQDFYSYETMAFDRCPRETTPGTAHIVMFKRTATSGTVINIPSTNWCLASANKSKPESSGIDGPNGDQVKRIIMNAMHLLAPGNSLDNALSKSL